MSIRIKQIEIMEFKGIKGKWDYVYDNSDYSPHEWYNITSENNGNILKRSYYETDLTFEQMKANALLISKAPEMLEMLEMHIYALDNSMLDFYKKYGFNISELSGKVRELIKEATEV